MFRGDEATEIVGTKACFAMALGKVVQVLKYGERYIAYRRSTSRTLLPKAFSLQYIKGNHRKRQHDSVKRSQRERWGHIGEV